MKKTKNILFLGFKNKASFAFVQPLIFSLLSNNKREKFVFNLALTPSLLLNFLVQDVLKDFSKFIKKRSFIIYISLPDLNDIKFNFKNKKIRINLVKYFLVEYLFCLPTICLTYLIFKKFPRLITNTKIVSTNKFSLLLLSGTEHISGYYLLKRILSNSSANYKLIWLPHAPHGSSSDFHTPSILENAKLNVDLWLPITNVKIKSKNKKISTFLSGYPPFATNEIKKIRRLINKSKINSKHYKNLVVLLRQTEVYGKKATDFTYSYQQTLSLLSNLSIFVKNNNFSKITFCLHPSSNISNIRSLKVLINKFEWPAYNVTLKYFLSFVDKNTLVTGAYTTVLLHSALSGLKTICFKDNIINKLEKDEPFIWKIYHNSPMVFSDIKYDSLSEVYKNLNMQSFEKFSIHSISQNQNFKNSLYLSELADKQFLSAIKRIEELS